jgi:DNA-binding FrmR family transcriptional regulator
MQILASLASRIDSVLQDVTGHLFSELQDKELEAAQQLIKISPRASGALAGVVLERHLQRTFKNHALTTRKKNPTISDLNDPLKQAGVYGVPVWRKIQLLADIRNMCSHQKDDEPTKEQVKELIEGVNSIVKMVF